MSKLKRIATAAGFSTIETVITGTRNLANKATRTIRHNYWRERALELNPIIEDCNECLCNDVQTGYYLQKVVLDYCPTHQPEAVKIIRGYNKSHK